MIEDEDASLTVLSLGIHIVMDELGVDSLQSGLRPLILKILTFSAIVSGIMARRS
jgi:hypothetical protein